MIMIGVIFMFLFHAFFLLIVFYASVFRFYDLLIEKGVEMDKIIAYNPVISWILFWLRFFFNTSLKFVVAVGIWIGLVSYYKKSEKIPWIKKCFSH